MEWQTGVWKLVIETQNRLRLGSPMWIASCTAFEKFSWESHNSNIILIGNSDIESLYQVVPTTLCRTISLTVQNVLWICCFGEADNLLTELYTCFRAVTGSNINHDTGYPKGTLILITNNKKYS
jgi:hypothetical protein